MKNRDDRRLALGLDVVHRVWKALRQHAPDIGEHDLALERSRLSSRQDTLDLLEILASELVSLPLIPLRRRLDVRLGLGSDEKSSAYWLVPERRDKIFAFTSGRGDPTVGSFL